MRAHNDENKPMLLILAVGDELLNAVAVSPEEVELTRATEIRLNNECYTLQKDGDKISYALKEAWIITRRFTVKQLKSLT